MNRFKVLKSAAKALLPFNAQLRRLSRRLRPYQDNRRNTNFAIDQGLAQIRMLRSAKANLTGTILEFGSGWVPAIPFLFHLAGARRVILTDVERLMDAHTVSLARRAILDRIKDISDVLSIPEVDLIQKAAAKFDPDYFVPWDSAQHPAHSVDVIVSRTVLEHIPPPSLEKFFVDFARILVPGGYMCHIVDNSDHWEHTDKSLSRVAFLRYDQELIWKLSCINTQTYQNRMRHSDYLGFFNKHGWVSEVVEGVPDTKCLTELQTLPLAGEFKGRDHKDLAILTSYFALRRA